MPKRVTQFTSDRAQPKAGTLGFAERKYLKSLEATLSEWRTPEDAAAYDGALETKIKKPGLRRKNTRKQ